MVRKGKRLAVCPTAGTCPSWSSQSGCCYSRSCACNRSTILPDLVIQKSKTLQSYFLFDINSSQNLYGSYRKKEKDLCSKQPRETVSSRSKARFVSCGSVKRKVPLTSENDQFLVRQRTVLDFPQFGICLVSMPFHTTPQVYHIAIVLISFLIFEFIRYFCLWTFVPVSVPIFWNYLL